MTFMTFMTDKAAVSSMTLTAINQFIAADHFKVDTSASAKVKIGWMCDQFKLIFLGKVEGNVPAIELNIHQLKKGALDKDIRAELDPKGEKITLGQFYQALAKLSAGWYFAYIEDAAGTLWVVFTHWDGHYGGWSVYACSVGNPFGWHAGLQLLSRKCA